MDPAGAGRSPRVPPDAAGPRPPPRRLRAPRPLADPARDGDLDQARQPRPGHLSPATGGGGRAAVRDAEAAGVEGSLAPGRGRLPVSPRRSTGHALRPLPPPYLARRDPQSRQRPARPDGP